MSRGDERLDHRLRQYKLVRRLAANVRHLAFHARSLPDWLRWRLSPPRPSPPKSGCEGSEGPLHIAFVSQRARTRESKLAYAARLCGHHVSLISSHPQADPLMERDFDAQIHRANPWGVLSALEELAPDVIHLFGSSFGQAQLLPVMANASSPVVFDPYDVLQGMIRPECRPNQFELKAERLCFALASHICSRSLEPLYLRRQFGLTMPDATFFPEFCRQPPVRRPPRPVSESEELHIVYCGGVWPEDRYPASVYGYAQYLGIGSEFRRQGLHLHIYPAPLARGARFEDFYALYLKEEASNPYFHLHRPLPHRDLVERLADYDGALHIMGAGIDQSLGRLTRAKLDYSAASKLFDYVEAGLPVIIHSGRTQRGIVRHYGQSVEVDHISQVRRALSREIRKGNDRRGRADLEFHAQRLGSMYRRVVKECASSS